MLSSPEPTAFSTPLPIAKVDEVGHTPYPITPGGSLLSPCEDSMSTFSPPKPLEDLNKFLQSRDISPVRSQCHTPLDVAIDRTKRYYIRKARESVTAVMEELAPCEPEALLDSASNAVFAQYSKGKGQILMTHIYTVN